MDNRLHYKELEEDILEYIFHVNREEWRQPDDSPIDFIYTKDNFSLIAEFKSRNIHSDQYDSFFIEPHKIKGIFNRINVLNITNYKLYFVVYCAYSNDIFIFDLVKLLKNGDFKETDKFRREKNHISSNSKVVNNSCYTIQKKLNIKKLKYDKRH